MKKAICLTLVMLLCLLPPLAQAAAPAAHTITAAQVKEALAEMEENGRGYARLRLTGETLLPAGALEALGATPLYLDTGSNPVQTRIMLHRPDLVTEDLLVSGRVEGSVVESRAALFERFFENPVRVMQMDQAGSFGQTVEIAAKLDLSGMDTSRLCLYSYDRAAHQYTRIANPGCWVDKNGYLHFTTALAGAIVVSQGELVKREVPLPARQPATTTRSGSSGGGSSNVVINPLPGVPVTGVTLSDHALTLHPAGGRTSHQLTAAITPPSAADQRVVWSSSAPEVASVSPAGLVEAHSLGRAVITVTTRDGGYADTCAVTVEPAPSVPVPVTGVTLSESTLELDITAGSHQFTATVSPPDATNAQVTWESSDPAVATVSTTGLVELHRVGTATITATTADGRHSAACQVTVTGTILIGGQLTMSNTLANIAVCDITAPGAPDGTFPRIDWDPQQPLNVRIDIDGFRNGTATMTITVVGSTPAGSYGFTASVPGYQSAQATFTITAP